MHHILDLFQYKLILTINSYSATPPSNHSPKKLNTIYNPVTKMNTDFWAGPHSLPSLSLPPMFLLDVRFALTFTKTKAPLSLSLFLSRAGQSAHLYIHYSKDYHAMAALYLMQSPLTQLVEKE